MATATITGFFQDEDGAWVAQLSCGHRQHVRHDPPWNNRPWVLQSEGRQEKLGSQLQCPYCDMPRLPTAASEYKRTRVFTQETIPRALTRNHTTAAGVWARIVVEQGRLKYVLDGSEEQWVLRPGTDGIVAPQQPHRVEPQGPVRFFVAFMRPDGAGA